MLTYIEKHERSAPPWQVLSYLLSKSDRYGRVIFDSRIIDGTTFNVKKIMDTIMDAYSKKLEDRKYSSKFDYDAIFVMQIDRLINIFNRLENYENLESKLYPIILRNIEILIERKLLGMTDKDYKQIINFILTMGGSSIESYILGNAIFVMPNAIFLEFAKILDPSSFAEMLRKLHKPMGYSKNMSNINLGLELIELSKTPNIQALYKLEIAKYLLVMMEYNKTSIPVLINDTINILTDVATMDPKLSHFANVIRDYLLELGSEDIS